MRDSIRRRKGTQAALLAGLVLTGAFAGSQGPPAPAESPAPVSPIVAAVGSMEAAGSNPGRRAALEAMLRDLGVPYEAEAFTIEARENYPRTEGANLVVTLGAGDSDIVVGAHYDAAWLPGAVLSGGAVDNAASAVILARLAGTLSGADLRHRVRIVFFDMEEIGLVGSRRYIETHAAETIRAAVNLDVNGYGDTVFYGPAAAPGNATLYDVVRDHCALERLRCLEFPAYPASDHRSFQAAGIPNISFSVLPALEAHELWLFLNGGAASFRPGFAPAVLRTIHSPADTADRIEAAAMELGLRSLAAFVRRLDAVLE